MPNNVFAMNAEHDAWDIYQSPIMALELTLLVGFLLGLTANIYAFAVAGVSYSALNGLLALAGGDVFHAALTTIELFALLQIGFGGAFALQMAYPRFRGSRTPPDPSVATAELPPLSR